MQDAFHWEHVKQEREFPAGGVPYRVPKTSMQNKNEVHRLAKIMSNIKMNLQEFVHPVSVPLETADGDAADPDDFRDVSMTGDREHVQDL